MQYLPCLGTCFALCLISVWNTKAVVGALNQEKVLVGAFSMIVKTDGSLQLYLLQIAAGRSRQCHPCHMSIPPPPITLSQLSQNNQDPRRIDAGPQLCHWYCGDQSIYNVQRRCQRSCLHFWILEYLSTWSLLINPSVIVGFTDKFPNFRKLDSALI